MIKGWQSCYKTSYIKSRGTLLQEYLYCKLRPKVDSVNNKIIHQRSLVREPRYLYFFSDWIHLIKCIRTRLQKEGILTPPEGKVSWEHYRILFKTDSEFSNSLRICPKLTEDHINTSNLMKMRVKLATQIFSNSVCHGLKYYKEKGVAGLEDASSTILFTKRMNDLFDLLNSKTFYSALTKETDFSKEFGPYMEWLDNWERSSVQNDKTFLTKSTAQGLRVTLKSTMELAQHLLNNCNFKYVLTGKLNQDCLEHFFGIARQASGPNDHPTFTTFMQVYRMLSSYSLIRPPKFSNCTVQQSDFKPTISLIDFKNIFENKSEKKDYVSVLQNKIDTLLSSEEDDDVQLFEVDETIFVKDSDFKEAVIDSVIYYVAGFIVKSITRTTNCDLCISSLKNQNFDNLPEEAFLTVIKTRGSLVHPQSHVYYILRQLERHLSKNILSTDVYNQTIEDFFDNCPDLKFDCETHRSYVLASLIHNFIVLRMRFFAKQQDVNSKKNSREKKKVIKIVFGIDKQ